MALRLRRGTEDNRTSMSPALVEGELAYVTDHVDAGVSPLWIGDGSAPGGVPVAPVLTVNSKVGQVELYTDDITEGDSENNFWFTQDRAQDAAAALFTTTTTSSTTHSGISFAYNDADGKIVATVSATGNITAGTTGQIPFYASNGTTVQGSYNPGTGAQLLWNNNSGTLSIESGGFGVWTNGAGYAISSFSTHANTSASNRISIRKSRGTNASPLTLQNADSIGALSFEGRAGTGYTIGAQITAQTENSVSTGILPTGIAFSTTDAAGELQALFRLTHDGIAVVGPVNSTQSGTGRLTITSIYNPPVRSGDVFNDSALSLKFISDTIDAQNISLQRSRGTLDNPQAVISGDDVADIIYSANNGSGFDIVGQITCTTAGTTGQTFSTAFLRFGVLTTTGFAYTTKIDGNRVLTHDGTIATTKAPATFWNYDTTGSTLTLTLGQVVTFANFSGSVLVNCYNSGTVSQYLCGGGGAPICVGSSKVAQTGTMQAISGGYTFTASEAGVHSFYVIRTRTGA